MNDENGTIDVLDSNYPLMVRLKGCNGTYGHSKNVASLMEACAAALGLDVVAVRIAGFFHDIGKTNATNYFAENQSDETGNPHDNLPPHISFRIISSHPAESASILINDPNIDREVAVWVSQHHGTTLMKSIFEKADTQNEESYRYKGIPPQSIEAGLLMLCDQLEAKFRAMYQAGSLKDVELEISKTFDEITLNEGQWDDIKLTFKEIKVIKETLANELRSMYKPKRPEYPEQADENGGSGSGAAEE